MSLEDLTPEQRARLTLMDALLKNPETQKEVRKLARKADPNFRPPDLDIEDRLEREREERRREQQEIKDQMAQDQRNRWYEDQKRKVAAANLDIAKIEEVMKTKKIADYDTAIEYLQAQQQLAPATPASVTPMSMPLDKDLWKDPKGTASKIAHEMISGFRSGALRPTG